MAINFPDSPSINDTYVVDDKTFVWTGDYWRVYTAASSIDTLVKDADNDTKVTVEQSADEDTVRIFTAGTERYSIASDGHIIPTANETYDLGSATNRFRDIYLSGTSINLGGVEISSDGTNLALPPISSVSGDFTVDTSTLHVDSTNNRVGVGTAAPEDTLHVYGPTRFSSTTGQGTTHFPFTDGRFYYTADPETGGAGDHVFRHNSSGTVVEQMRILENGNVGIGTTSPSRKLIVSGSGFDGGSADFISTNSGNGLLVTGVDGAGINDSAYLVLRDQNYYWIAGLSGTNAGAGDFRIADSVAGERLRIDSATGNVGIGTVSPGRKLHVDAGSSGGMIVESDTDSSLRTITTSGGTKSWNIGNYYTTWNGLTNPFIIQPIDGSGTQDISITPVTNSPGSGLIIKADGRVCVGGDTNPGAHFTVKAAGTGNNDGLVEFHSWTGSPTSPTEVEDWPTPVLALRAYDDFFAQQMLSFGYPNDAIYQTGGSVWSFRLESGYGATSSSSSTNLNLLGPGTFKVGNFNASGTKTFRISHPLPELNETHDLLHNAVESPQADNLYRGSVTLVDGLAVVNLDESAGMTEGTFILLNRDIQCFTSNESGWTNIRGSVDGNVLTIEAQDGTCTDTVSWLVIGERQDSEIKASPDTDEDGHLIVEPVTNRVTEEAIAESVARMEAAKEALESGS